MSTAHRSITDADLHVPGYVDAADPGAVGAGKYWVDTSGGSGSWVLKVRNAADDDWEEVASGGSGVTDHGALTGLADDDHTQYRREDEDHTHASSGAQGGTIGHGALTGVTANQHHNEDHASRHAAAGADPLMDGTAPSTQAFGDAAAAGAATVAAKRDHKHAMPADPRVGLVHTINFLIDGGGGVITTGIKGDLIVDFACTVTKWTVLADVSGSIVVDIWKDTYANHPPTVADTMTGAEKPTISGATKGQDTSLNGGAGWAIAAGSILRFNVDSAATVKRVLVALTVART